MRFITLPLIRPGVFSVGIFAELTSLDNLPRSFFFGGAITNTPPMVMLSYTEKQLDPSIAAARAVQMVAAMAALLLLDGLHGIGRMTAV